MSATVTLDREEVIDLLAHLYAACNLLDDGENDLGSFTDELRSRMDVVTEATLGSLDDNVVSSLWERADTIGEANRAR
jgi:hypothetical protein